MNVGLAGDGVAAGHDHPVPFAHVFIYGGLEKQIAALDFADTADAIFLYLEQRWRFQDGSSWQSTGDCGLFLERLCSLAVRRYLSGKIRSTKFSRLVEY